MKTNYPALYAVALGLFLLLDGLWLGVVAKKLYATELKGLMTNNVKWGAAALFYCLFVGFLVYFAVSAGIQADSVGYTLQRGAMFGFITYATYDLTNYATLKGFPLKIVIIDLIWGTVVSGAVATLAHLLYTKILG